MEVGKLSEDILKSSIFERIHTRRDEVLLGAGVGEDCAVMKLNPGEVFVISTDPITGTVKDTGTLAIQVTANDLASSGAEPVGVLLTVLLPEDTGEADIGKMMEQVENACSRFHIQVMGGHTEITRAVTQPVLSVTGVGKASPDRLVSTSGAEPGDDIIVTKWIGVEGTSIIAREKEAELLREFPVSFVETAKSFEQYISILPEAAAAVDFGVHAMHDVTEGGIYGALWELSQASGTGLEIDRNLIPIREETAKICDYFGLDPFRLISSGSLLIAAEDGEGLVKELKDREIPAAVVGKAVTGKACRILDGSEESFLKSPETDELYKIYAMQ